LALDEPIKAQIAHLHGAILAELGYTKRTGLGAGSTTGTRISVNDHDTILCPLGDGSTWASLHAARLATVHARVRDGPIAQVGILAGPHAGDSAPCDSQFEVIVRLARNFTGVTLNATIQVEVEPKLFSHSL
jgi:hypothetical protein